MPHDQDDIPAQEASGPSGEARARQPRRVWRRILLGVLTVMVLAVLYGWMTRERIARDVISGQLESAGIEATYDIESIGAKRQVVTNVVIGDPARPDLTIERVEVAMRLGLGVPSIGRITLVRPRLFGTYLRGKLSFGALDPVLFAQSEEPFRLPDLDIALRDGRGLIDSEYGPIGIKVEGEGRLRDGFAGIVAASAPEVQVAACRLTGASLFGKVRVSGEKPAFKGPLRLAGLTCADPQARLVSATLDVDAGLTQAFDGGEGRLRLVTGAMALAGNAMRSVSGTMRVALRDGDLTAHFDVAGQGLAAPQVAARSLAVEGRVRSADGFARIEAEGSLTGAGIRPGPALDNAMAGLERAGGGTLAAPMLAQVRDALRREGEASSLASDFVVRKAGERLSVIVPRGSLRGSSGQALLSLSRFQMSTGGAASPRISGNFATGGPGLPKITGRMEQQPGGSLAMRVRMPEYRAGGARLALAELMVVQARSGALGFAGQALVSGPLPGGEARGLVLPIDGNWSSGSGLAVWRKCVNVRFDRLELAGLLLERRALPLCPASNGAIVRSDARGLRIAAGAPSLDLAGRLGETPIRIASGPVGFAVPGNLTARALRIALGPADTVSRFEIARLDARIDDDIAGTFDGSEISLDAVPLDLFETGGTWRYAGGKLSIADASFRLEDREQVDRFQPLVARGATLELVDGRILANAVLREPTSDREVVRTVIRHDLGTGGGDAELLVDGIVFDDKLQPAMLTRNALGVIANAEGVVRGTGAIDWHGPEVSSTGTFSTDGFDFAAAFGPVKGASGTIAFTDLLGIVTAPDQRLAVASINPGIEVLDGEVVFELRPDAVLQINGGEWPFLGGQLTLLPATMNMGVSGDRRFTLKITALDAAKLLEHMDMANLAASGTFDGEIPLLFDEDGGHLMTGYLVSRPPGGHLSYVGALTYKDMSTMANFAFDALKDLNYRSMRVTLDGPLEGEIITRVTFDGVTQGATARRNFITKQIARLPVRFNVNIRAAFFQLVTSLRSIYDPEYVRDPRTLGLVETRDGRFVRGSNPGLPESSDQPSATAIQPPESETVP